MKYPDESNKKRGEKKRGDYEKLGGAVGSEGRRQK